MATADYRFCVSREGAEQLSCAGCVCYLVGGGTPAESSSPLQVARSLTKCLDLIRSTARFLPVPVVPLQAKEVPRRSLGVQCPLYLCRDVTTVSPFSSADLIVLEHPPPTHSVLVICDSPVPETASRTGGAPTVVEIVQLMTDWLRGISSRGEAPAILLFPSQAESQPGIKEGHLLDRLIVGIPSLAAMGGAVSVGPAGAGPGVAVPWLVATLACGYAAHLEARYDCAVQRLLETTEQLSDVRFEYERLLNAAVGPSAGATTFAAQPGKPGAEVDYRRLICRLREIVRESVPPDATVLVANKGDPELVRLDGRTAWHFPQDPGGGYAGHHPESGGAAVAHLHDLEARGAEYLVLPAPLFWWLEHYPEFNRHLETGNSLVARDNGVCAVYMLGTRRRESGPVRPHRGL